MYVRREVLGMPILNPEEGSSSSGSLAEVTWTLVGESSKVAQTEQLSVALVVNPCISEIKVINV